jgi:hypothetical protein
MKHVFALVAFLMLSSTSAHAGMYITGSGSTEMSNMSFQTQTSNYGSASLGFDLGRYISFSVTHSQQYSVTTGHKNPDDQSGDASPAGNDDPADDDQLIEFTNRSHVIGNSADLRLVLYEGEMFIPYVTGGIILKTYRIVTQEAGKADDVIYAPNIPGPNLGAGIGFPINKEFMLKLQYIASPGQVREPGDAKARNVWDKKTTVGIQYKI